MAFLSYILTWRLAAALLLWGVAVFPVRKAYGMLRNGDVWVRGTVEEVFLSSLLVAVAAAVYPFAGVGIPVLWYVFVRKHLISGKGFCASLIAIFLVALYTFLAYRFFHLPFWPFAS